MDCQTVRDDMLDVLYGEADEATRRRVAAHHEGCSACRDELFGLRRVRKDLALWTLPKESARRDGPLERLPRWLPLAAGVLVALGGFGLGATEVSGLRQRLARLEASAPVREMPARGVSDLDEAAVLSRVAQMIEASESRQRQRIQAEMAGLESRQEARRRYDMAQMSAGLSYLEGKTGLQMARTTELVGHALQAAQER